MKKKRASDIFHPVDPKLVVIGGHRRRKTTKKDWEMARGKVCPRCGQEALRFRPRDGVCTNCARDLDEKQDRDDNKRARQLKFIKQHNARIDRKRATK